jgi:polyketide synthase 7
MEDAKTLEHLRRAVAGLREANQRLADMGAAAAEPIAIIGMACRYPGGVQTPEQLWSLVWTGTDAVTGFPADRGWDIGSIYGPGAGPARPAQGGFVDNVAGFDAGFFGITPRQALIQDPRQRLLLEISWEAFERAGVVPASLRGAEVGVFVGASGQDYLAHMQQVPGLTEGYLLSGDGTAWLSGRLAYFFGFHGPALTLDTACSSTLVALHEACQSLRRGECTMALAGGASVMVSPILFSESSIQRALASDGRCKAYAQAADGTGWGEGAGILLLERLSDADRHGHPVLALVRGSAINSDGASGRMTAPHGPSQEQVINHALAAARLAPADIDAVEGHGTGTPLGDPIEVGALIASYGPGHTPRRPLWLGSVKSNIGHTQAASGAAGVIKMVKAMEHGVLPPTLGIDQPSGHVDWSAGVVRLLTEPVDWPADSRPRRAAVSSFGGSGTNAHVILEQPGPHQVAGSTPSRRPDPDRAVPCVVSARSAAALRAQAAGLRDLLQARPSEREPGLADIAWSLAACRSVFEHRAVIVSRDRTVLAAGLEAVAAGAQAANLVTGTARTGADRVAFIFPGQGWQWAGMGTEMLRHSAIFAEEIARCDEALVPLVGWSVAAVLRQEPDAPSLDRLDVVQPVLFAVMVSLAAVWGGFGIRPAAVVGHSQGEVAAAYVAGALSLADAAKIVVRRSQVMMAAAGGGAMLAIARSAAEVCQMIERFGGSVSIAVRNGPASVTVGGTTEAIEELERELQAAGTRARRIKGAVGAGHTALVEAIRDDLMSALGTITPQRSGVPFYSTVTGDVLDASELSAGYWYSNARRTVLFEPAVTRMLKDGYTVFVESSAHPVLASAVGEIAEEFGADVVTAPTLRRDDGGQHRLLLGVAELWASGVATDWTPAFAGPPRHRVDLPTYPFQRRDYWLSGVAAPGSATASAGRGQWPAEPPDETAEQGLDIPAPAERLGLLHGGELDRALLDMVRAECAALAGYPSAQDIEPTAHFLELGFDSLLIAKFRGRLSAASGLRLPAGLAFECPSPIALAGRLRELLEASAGEHQRSGDDSLVRLYQRACDAGMATDAMAMLEHAARLVPSFAAPHEATPRPAPVRLAQGPALPAVVCLTPYLVSFGALQYARFAGPFRGERTVWVVPHPGFAAGEPIPASLEPLLGLHAQTALEVAADAPIALFGHSAGGWVAHGVAAALEGLGRPPVGLIMADSFGLGARDKSAIFDAWMRGHARDPESPQATADELIASGRYKRLFDEWDPPAVSAPTLLIKAGDATLLDPVGGRSAVGAPESAGDVVEVPGNHFTMMTDHAASTAAAAQTWLTSQRRRKS